LEDREEISRGLAKGLDNKDIAVSLGQDESVIFREITRHGGREKYRAHRVDAAARQSRSRPDERKIDTVAGLRERVTGDLRKSWSPEQIAGRLSWGGFPGETGMSVSHEAICTWIFARPRGAARGRRPLRTGREQRKPQGRTKTAGAKIVGIRSIEERPAEVAGRQVPRPWESQRCCQAAGASSGGLLRRSGYRAGVSTRRRGTAFSAPTRLIRGNVKWYRDIRANMEQTCVPVPHESQAT
jgi:transposase, IS30 family